MMKIWGQLAMMAAAALLMARAAARLMPVGRGWVRRLAPVMMYAVVSTTPCWVGDENLLILLPFFTAVILFSYGGPWYARLTVGMVFYVQMISINMVLDTVAQWYPSFWFERLLSIGIKTAVYALICLCVCRFVPKRAAITMPAKLWGIVGALTLAPLISMLSFSVWGIQYYVTEEADQLLSSAALTFLPFIILSSFAMLSAIVLLARHEALEKEHQLAGMREVYYEALQREQTQVRTLRHDLRNHLTAVRGLLAQGDSGRALAYLDEMTDSPAFQGAKRFCENETANAVLASKAAVIEAEGLSADMGAALPARLPIADPDLVALIGNAIDNAIEAARRARDKRITVRLRADKGLFMLRVQNAAEQPLRRENGTFATTKADRTAHGFGLAGMREIAARHAGTLEAGEKDGKFELVVCIPLDPFSAGDTAG